MRPGRPRKVVHVAIYGAALAGLALVLQWMDVRHALHRWTTEFYVLCVAVLFAVMGAWIGARLVPRSRSDTFAVNAAAQSELGISPRELEVLVHLAEGAANKVIARRLAISPNTVKTHVASLLGKLDAANRTEAIAHARAIGLLP